MAGGRKPQHHPSPLEVPVPYRTIAQEALERWRDAQRRLDIAPPDSPEWQQAYVDSELAKGEYDDAVREAEQRHLPVPPPFNEAIGASEDDGSQMDVDAAGDDTETFDT
jgi:hypothetical protein